MAIQFVFPDGRVVETPCYRSLNLLAHAQLEELEIGSRCGGHGVCGGDRLRIRDEKSREELSPVTEAERKHLTPEEIENGWRLACQCFPARENLSLQVSVR